MWRSAVSRRKGLSGRKEGKTRLMNIVMQLRKGKDTCPNALEGLLTLCVAVACHPYLFDGAVSHIHCLGSLSRPKTTLGTGSSLYYGRAYRRQRRENGHS